MKTLDDNWKEIQSTSLARNIANVKNVCENFRREAGIKESRIDFSLLMGGEVEKSLEELVGEYEDFAELVLGSIYDSVGSGKSYEESFLALLEILQPYIGDSIKIVYE